MYLKVFTLVALFTVSFLQANPEPCGCSSSTVQPIFTHGWNTVETDLEKGYALILKDHFGVQTPTDLQLISLRKRPVSFYTHGWLYEFTLLENDQEQLVYLINNNMGSVLLNDPKKVKTFFKDYPPILESDIAALEFLVIKTKVRSKNELDPKMLFSSEGLPKEITKNGPYISGPRVIHQDDNMYLIQAFVMVNQQVFSAIYEIAHDQNSVQMKDSFKVSNLENRTVCSASYTNTGVSYINLKQTNTPQVDLQ